MNKWKELSSEICEYSISPSGEWECLRTKSGNGSHCCSHCHEPGLKESCTFETKPLPCLKYLCNTVKVKIVSSDIYLEAFKDLMSEALKREVSSIRSPVNLFNAS
jgi:hypothetical protein